MLRIRLYGLVSFITYSVHIKERAKLETTGQKHINISVYKETLDEWYPSFQIRNRHIDPEQETKLVNVSFIHLITGQWRVCVWGADDYGLE